MAKKTKGTADKGGKKPFGKRVKSFFSNIFAEIKRVIWPDKRKLRQSTVTVLIIIILATAIIWLFDTVVGAILRATGFYAPVHKKPVMTDGPSITEPAGEPDVTQVTVSDETTPATTKAGE